MIREGAILGGRYEVMGRIGIGGMADVYKAADRVLNRYVAIKVLKREFREDENFVKKFWSEAQSAAGLQHPNIVNIYDVAEDRGLYYIVMELVEGITLKDYIQKKGKLTPKEVIGIALQVCAGLESAHSNGIIHRDVKPQNIIISKEGKVKVTDFGIAKATSSNTISTNVMGSVHYTSPEQARGGFSDAKSDIYSLGITMYEMITGILPFVGDSTVSIALKHLQEDIVQPSEYVVDLPYSLEQIVLKCTQKSADRRYATVSQLVRDLKRSLQEPDGDFVRIAPLVNVSDTVIVTPEELERIQGGVEYESEYGDDYDEEYDDEEYERERRRKAAKKKNEVDPRMAKVMKVMTIVASIVFVGVLVLIIGNVAGLFKPGTGVIEQDQSHYVPKLVGMKLEEAEEACLEAGLVLVVAREEEHEKYDKGYVFKQMTSEGTKLPEGTKVQVYISSGIKVVPIEIPDVSNKSEKEALIELVNLGFVKKNITVKTEEHATIEAEKVTRTEPAAAEKGNKDSKITIYVSNGNTKVPNIVGKTKTEAEQLLTAAGLVGEATVDEQSDAPEGEVLTQEQQEGEVLEQGAKVAYTVSAGAEKVEIPKDLIGKHYYNVIRALEELGFEKISTDGTMSTKYNREMVVSIENKAGDKLTGTKITLDTEIIIYVNELMSNDNNDADTSTSDDGSSQSDTPESETTPSQTNPQGSPTGSSQTETQKPQDTSSQTSTQN